MLSACTDGACALTYRNKGTPGQDNWRPLIASVGRPANTWLVGTRLSIKVIVMDGYCTLCGRRGHSASHCPWGSYLRIRCCSSALSNDGRSF